MAGQLVDLENQTSVVSDLIDEATLLLESEDPHECRKIMEFGMRMENEIERWNAVEMRPIRIPQNELVPLYEPIKLVIPHFTRAVERGRAAQKEDEKVVCSESGKLHGGIWTVKVWPSGVAPHCRECVSVQLELSRGSKQPMECAFKMVIPNPTDRGKAIVRESRVRFREGDCWGWDNALELARSAEFLVDSALHIKVEVRPVSWKVLYDVVSASYEAVKARHRALRPERATGDQ
jgi:hypothetical protein